MVKKNCQRNLLCLTQLSYMAVHVESNSSNMFQIPEEKLKASGKIWPMKEARAVDAAIVQMSPHVLLTDLAKLLNRDVSALGKAAHRVAGSGRGCGTVREKVDKMRFAGSRMSETPT